MCQPHRNQNASDKSFVAKYKVLQRAKNTIPIWFGMYTVSMKSYILIWAVKNFCQSSCSQFGFFFGDHGPRVGGGCWLEDGLREIGTWPGGQQMEGHTSRTSRFYKKKYKSTTVKLGKKNLVGSLFFPFLNFVKTILSVPFFQWPEAMNWRNSGSISSKMLHSFLLQRNTYSYF